MSFVAIANGRDEGDQRHSLPGVSGFVDECRINVRGGDGGAGAVSFRREAHVPRGGPDGGDGAKGGDVWLIADHNVASLLAFRDHPHRKAESGTHGSGKGRHGHRGEDLIVPVPEGTAISRSSPRRPCRSLPLPWTPLRARRCGWSRNASSEATL